jgi:vacuolar-type H+-ATPase subunit H
LGWLRLPWEAWTAFGTWFLAFATWALVLFSRSLVRRTQEDARAQIAAVRETADAQVAAARQAAKDQMAVAERMAKEHVHALEEDLKARLLLHYETRWDSGEMKVSRRRLSNILARKVQAPDARMPREVIPDDVPSFFESVGILVRRGHLDIEMVSHVFGYYAMRYGQMLGRFMVEDRRAHDDPQLWTGFEYIVETLRKFDAQHLNRSEPHFSGEELKRFFLEEAAG